MPFQNHPISRIFCSWSRTRTSDLNLLSKTIFWNTANKYLCNSTTSGSHPKPKSSARVWVHEINSPPLILILSVFQLTSILFYNWYTVRVHCSFHIVDRIVNFTLQSFHHVFPIFLHGSHFIIGTAQTSCLIIDCSKYSVHIYSSVIGIVGAVAILLSSTNRHSYSWYSE